MRKADRAVSFFVIDPFEIQVYRIVVQQLFELRGRYFVGVEVLLVLVIPIKFDPAGHRPILYRNVYTFRIVVRPPLIDPAVVFAMLLTVRGTLRGWTRSLTCLYSAH